MTEEGAPGGLAPVDRWTLAYTAVVTAALVWRWPPRVGGFLILIHVLLVALALVAPSARKTGGAVAFLGDFYPLIVILALYTEVGILNERAGVTYDPVVQRWEIALFGGQPSLAWIREHPWPWLSTIFHFSYMSFFVIVAGAPLGLWITKRRAGARRMLGLVMATFYVCYTVFLLFPVAGPRFLFPLPENEAARTGIAAFTHALVSVGSAWGTAFPSSHVAVAVVASVSAWREWRPLGASMMAATVLLVLGTIYGQFHYAVDALAGAVVGVAVLAGSPTSLPRGTPAAA